MVVIVIVGILSIVALPTYKKYVANSKTAEAYTILGDMAKSEIIFHGENSYFLPLASNPGGFPTNKVFNDDEVGWSQGWGGPFIKSPLATGTQLNFSFAASAGNETGQYSLGSWVDLTAEPPVSDTLSDPSSLFFDSGKASQNCVGEVVDSDIESVITPENLGILSNVENKWAILLAQGDIFGDNQCRYLYSVVKAVENKNASMDGGFVLIDRNYNQ